MMRRKHVTTLNNIKNEIHCFKTMEPIIQGTFKTTCNTGTAV